MSGSSRYDMCIGLFYQYVQGDLPYGFAFLLYGIDFHFECFNSVCNIVSPQKHRDCNNKC